MNRKGEVRGAQRGRATIWPQALTYPAVCYSIWATLTPVVYYWLVTKVSPQRSTWRFAILHLLAGTAAAISMKCLRPLAIALLVAAGLTGVAADRQQPADPRPTRVLFIGNSLTTANNLPGIVEALARAAGDRIECRAVAFDGHSLEDHWNRGEARRAIAEARWSTVVLQQGPSALPESQVLLREYTKRFHAEVRGIGARTALYMVWPSVTRRGDFDGVSMSYAAAARDVGGLLFPVGEAWRAAWRRDSGLALYSRDGLHPTPAGSYLAALVIHQQLSGRSPVGLPATIGSPAGAGPVILLPIAQARLLQEAAAEANARHGM